jgi:hypothetical protein
MGVKLDLTLMEVRYVEGVWEQGAEENNLYIRGRRLEKSGC